MPGPRPHVQASVLATVAMCGCTHWGSTTSYGAPRELARRPIGAPQIATTSSSSLSAGFAGSSSTNRAGTRTSLLGGLSGSSDSMTRTHCIQQFDIDYEQPYQTVGKVESRGLDTVGGITLAVVGLAVIVSSQDQTRVTESGVDHYSSTGGMFTGGAMMGFGVGWVWYAHSRLPKGPPPTSAPQVRTWTATEFAEATGCGLVPGDVVAPRPAPAAAPTPAPAAPAATDVETRLKKLEDLRARGLITQEEYEAKRKAVLEDL